MSNSLLLNLVLKASTFDATSKMQAFKKQLQDVDATARNMGGLAGLGGNLQNFGSKLNTIGTAATLGLTAPILGIGAASVKAFSDFEAEMDKVQAIIGDYGKDAETNMKKLTDKAKQLGATTKFTAAEVGEGFEYMAMAGWKTEEMLKGIKPVLDLSAASGVDLGRTSDIVTDALTAMGYSADDAGHFADVLAKASSNSNTNVDLMGQTFKYAAPIAGTLGMSMEDVAIAVGLMANNGIKSSQAGTALRMGLTRLAAPTDKAAAAMSKYGISLTDAEGNVKPLLQIMQELREKLRDLPKDEQLTALNTMFGKHALSGWAAIINADADSFENLTEQIYNCDGAAAQMADTMMDNTQGKLILMRDALTGAGLAIGEALVPWIIKGANKITELANKFQELDKGTQGNIIKFALIAAAMGPVLSIVGNLAYGIGGLIKLFGGLAGGFGTVAGAASGLSTAAAGAAGAVGSTGGGLLSGLGGIIAAAGPVGGALLAIAGAAAVVGGAMYLAWRDTHQYTRAVDKMIDRQEDERQDIDDTVAKMEYYRDELNKLSSKENKTAEDKAKIAYYVEKLNEMMPDLNASYDAETDSLSLTNEQLSENIRLRKEQLDKDQYKEENDEALDTIIKNEEEYQKLLGQRKDLIERIQKIEANHNTVQNPEYTNLKSQLSTVETKLKNIEDANERLTIRWNANNDLMADSNAQTWGVMLEWFEEIKDEGKTVPESFIAEFKRMNVEIPSSMEELEALMDPQYQNLATIAYANGLAIPEYIKEGLANRSMTVAEAIDALSQLIDSHFAMEHDKLAVEGSQTIAKYAEGVEASKDLVVKAFESVTGIQNPVFKKAIEDAKFNAEDFVSSYASTVEANKWVVSWATNAMLDTQDPEFKRAIDNANLNGVRLDTAYAMSMISEASTPQEAARIVNNIVAMETGKTDKIEESGIKCTKSFSKGVKSGSPYAEAAASHVGHVMEMKLSKRVDTSSSIGRHFVDGFVMGIRQQAHLAWDAAVALGDAATGGLLSRLNINSPSKVTMEYGKYFTEGFAKGIVSSQALAKVKKSTQTMSNLALSSLASDADYSATGQDLSYLHNANQTITANYAGTISAPTDNISEAIMALAPYLADGVNKGIDNLTLEVDGRQFGRMVTRYA